MRYYPETAEDFKDFKEMNAPAWMLEFLKKNPSYLAWGNHEDYMCKKGEGWDSATEINSIDDLWGLDDLNELVNFYFFINRANKICPDCDQTGYNTETKKIADDWYDFDHTGRRWDDKLTQCEVDALWEHHRLHCDFNKKPTAEQVNTWSKKGFGHDAINRCICVKARAEQLGVWGLCSTCNGNGYVYVEDNAHLSLQMWFLHPRKGCSRGVILKNIEQDETDRVITYLKEAASRNAERFSRL